MKFVNFRLDDQIHLGIKLENGIVDVTAAAAAEAASQSSLKVPTTIEAVIAAGKRGLTQLNAFIQNKVPTISEEQLLYAPCVTHPEKILCVGLNYLSHREECDFKVPTVPVLFSKFNNALAAHDERISLPKTAFKFDYEAELVVVIGKEAANIEASDALSCVFGYTAGNDLSARDLQMLTGQWLIGKSCDHFAPIGPYLVTADEITDPQNLKISCQVNGTVRQSASTRDMIFDCAAIVSYISKYMTLKPGDIIFTGTPGGVILGYPEAEQKWLASGDKVAVSIEKIGTLVNCLN